jgi:hypothetical protein
MQKEGRPGQPSSALPAVVQRVRPRRRGQYNPAQAAKSLPRDASATPRRERLWREAPTRCSAESRIEPKPPEREWQASHRPRKTKAEAARILEVIRTDNPDKAATNLKFLVDAGLISDAGRKMLV